MYAASNDIWVPRHVIEQLYQISFGEMPVERVQTRGRYPSAPPAARPGARPSDETGVAHLRELLAEDPRTHELDVQIERGGNRVLLRGEVPSAERRDAVAEIVREACPGLTIENQIRVVAFDEPSEEEKVS
jgi:hypothetical protein